MTYQETLDYLYSRLPVFHRVGKVAYKADLTNTLALCEHLGNPQYAFKSIHIAGTNGKGSTSHMLAAILQEAGYKTGLYTSPHLKSFTERIRINGQPIPEQEVVDFVEQHQAVMEAIAPSFFEWTVAMAFQYFAVQNIDIAVIEVGLGGRLDSTNIITPELSLITNIGWDHTDILGDSLPKIAFEKAGIIKAGVPVVVSERQPETEAVFIEKACHQHAPLWFVSDEIELIDSHIFTENRRNVQVHSLVGKEPDFALQLGLLGVYQLKNTAGVLKAVEVLNANGWNISRQACQTGISQVTQLTGLKGRWQILSRSPLTICDTGHNEDGIRQVVQQLATLSYQKLHMVIGMVKDKDIRQVLALLPVQAHYYFCQAHIPRALDAHLLAQQAAAFGLQGSVIPDVNDALAEAQNNATPEDVVFVGGSTFIVAELDLL